MSCHTNDIVDDVIDDEKHSVEMKTNWRTTPTTSSNCPNDSPFSNWKKTQKLSCISLVLKRRFDWIYYNTTTTILSLPNVKATKNHQKLLLLVLLVGNSFFSLIIFLSMNSFSHHTLILLCFFFWEAHTLKKNNKHWHTILFSYQ